MREINQREPLTLSSPVCRPNATCDMNVTIAGFTWDCNSYKIPSVNIPTIEPDVKVGSLICSEIGLKEYDTDLIPC